MPEYDNKLEAARDLADEFAVRTGITGNTGNPERRYLWTDAFAVQTFFGLSLALDSEAYYVRALKLVDMVHGYLGKHRKDDPREGWISGLPEEEGRLHPTAGGLRIGKKLPERPDEENYDQMLEWERDGQYFHYLTRWFNALVQTSSETGEHKYAFWAAELIKAAESFIYKVDDRVRMYWKMNVNLSAPAVESMGAHDPLEGIICVSTAIEIVPEMKDELNPMKQDLYLLSRNMNWAGTDPLGIGGLLLAVSRSAELVAADADLPSSVTPDQLLEDILNGLRVYSKHLYSASKPAGQRLAFRECGLSLGIRVLHGLKDRYTQWTDKLDEVSSYLYLADEIEDFWLKSSGQRVSTWKDHQDINEVTLAASLTAISQPKAFCSCLI